MTKKVLICGATGFIGRNLLERFSSSPDYQVLAVYNKKKPILGFDNVEWIKADLRNPEDVTRALSGVDIVLQFAATTSGAKDITNKPYIHVTDNAVMNSYIFREAFEQGVEHVIFPSCTVMYQPSETALREGDFDGDEEIFSRYFGVGNTKVYLEKMCNFFSRISDTKFTALRHSNIYGPYDKYDLEKSHVFGATVTKAMWSDKKLTVWGTGEEKRDFLHVRDLVDFVQLAVEKQQSSYELFNVGCGKAVSVRDLVKTIIELLGRNLEIEHDTTKPTIKTSLFLDCSKAEKRLGWKPKISLRDGITDTIAWYRKNIL